MEYQIDLRAIKAASYAMSSEETRYYLKGVCLEISAAHGVLAIATDGHRIIAMQAAPGNGGTVPGFDMPNTLEIIIPADTVKRIKLNKRYSDGILRRMDGGQWQIEHDGQIWAFQPIDVSFPAWRRVLPKHVTPGERAHFNPDYLADMKKAGEVYVKGADAAIITDGGNPAWCRWDSDEVPGFGVVMPKRLLADAFTMNPPAWADWTPPAPKQANAA